MNAQPQETCTLLTLKAKHLEEELARVRASTKEELLGREAQVFARNTALLHSTIADREDEIAKLKRERDVMRSIVAGETNRAFEAEKRCRDAEARHAQATRHRDSVIGGLARVVRSARAAFMDPITLDPLETPLLTQGGHLISKESVDRMAAAKMAALAESSSDEEEEGEGGKELQVLSFPTTREPFHAQACIRVRGIEDFLRELRLAPECSDLAS